MRTLALVTFAALAVSAATSLAACGDASGPGAQTERELAIARVHRTRCGACHLRVEPGERTPDEFRAALARHHKRVRLTDAEWAEMLDYLSAPASPVRKEQGG